MTLVHCVRCGFLYEDGREIAMVVDSHSFFVGGVCHKCFDSSYNPVKGWSNMWYIDWITKRQRKLEK